MLIRFKLSKPQLDLLGTVFGVVAGCCGVLVTNQVGDQKIIGTIGGVATVLLGYVTQRPANAHPNTEDIEEKSE